MKRVKVRGPVLYFCLNYIYIYIYYRVSMRTIRLSSNYVYFVYCYTDVCDSILIDIFFSKT